MSEENQLKFEVDIGAIIAAGGITVLTPMYGGQCYGSFAKSVAELTGLCRSYGITLNTFFMYNESLVQRARNMCVDTFLRLPNKPELCIFIDADIEFLAQDILVMADFVLKNKYDVMCAPYAKKTIAFEKIVQAVNQGVADENPEILENFVGDFVINFLEPGSYRLDRPIEIAEGGTGFMMIHRNTLDKFAEMRPDKLYKPDHARSDDFDGSREVMAYFDCMIDPISKRYLSEDYYFCQVVRDLGMHIWLAPWINLPHTGTYTFKGSLHAMAQIGASPSADPNKLKKKKAK